MTDPFALTAGDYRVEIAPSRGGGITRFDWRGKPLFRPACGPGVLDLACFPLVPFSNRIANGRFRADGCEHCLPANLAGEPHPLHGMGWLAAWETVEQSDRDGVLRHDHEPGAWPWRYRTVQRLRLDETGLHHSLELANLSASPMFAGLGVHPYFPRTATTRYRALHGGEWRTGTDGLPIALDRAAEPSDWWDGAPVVARTVDTCYIERAGPIIIAWPDRGISLTITPDDALAFTHVYVPAGEDYFCVEPVSHGTDAINRADAGASGARWIDPGAKFAVALRYRAQEIG